MELSFGWVLALIIILLFVFLGSGLWVAFALGAVGLIGVIFFVGKGGGFIFDVVYNAACSYILAAIPLFIFMGEVVLRCGLSERLYRGISLLTRILPGGLLHSNIVSCALFAAISGSSVATAATIGTVAYPEQKKRGYDYKLTVGSLAAGGTIGILIPPSITLIIYGSFVGESVGRLFMAGVFPGILEALFYMTYIFFATVRNPSLGPPRESITKRYFLDFGVIIKDIWPILLLMCIIFGGIYTGIMTPTEAAGISCFVALVLAAFFRKLNFKVLKESAISALQTTAMIMLIIIGAKILTCALSMLKIPAQVCAAAGGLGFNRYIILIFVAILYLVLGCFMDGISLMLVTLPITYPLVVGTLGFNSVWFGIIVTRLVECALITPPVGLNLYVLYGVTAEKDFKELVKGILPFFMLDLADIIILTSFPIIVLFLPSTMLGT